jgi:hypothetical protein
LIVWYSMYIQVYRHSHTDIVIQTYMKHWVAHNSHERWPLAVWRYRCWPSKDWFGEGEVPWKERVQKLLWGVEIFSRLKTIEKGWLYDQNMFFGWVKTKNQEKFVVLYFFSRNFSMWSSSCRQEYWDFEFGDSSYNIWIFDLPVAILNLERIFGALSCWRWLLRTTCCEFGFWLLWISHVLHVLHRYPSAGQFRFRGVGWGRELAKQNFCSGKWDDDPPNDSVQPLSFFRESDTSIQLLLYRISSYVILRKHLVCWHFLLVNLVNLSSFHILSSVL